MDVWLGGVGFENAFDFVIHPPVWRALRDPVYDAASTIRRLQSLLGAGAVSPGLISARRKATQCHHFSMQCRGQ